MKCPACEETLVMADRQGVEIDYCPKCRGVWLDRGELDKIIERSQQNESRQAPSRDYKHDEDYDRRSSQHPHKKKRGFLGDFFDFD
jgi:Zn-finger nucleic acid-binding protein